MAELEESQTNGIIQTGTHQQHQAGNTPNEIVNSTVNSFYDCQKLIHINLLFQPKQFLF